jgi:hypothetical protein
MTLTREILEAKEIKCTGGLWKQFQEQENIGFSKDPFTLEQLQKAIGDMFYNRPQASMKTQLPAFDYPDLSDEDFKTLVTNPDAHFIGGTSGVEKLRARCKKLGIT